MTKWAFSPCLAGISLLRFSGCSFATISRSSTVSMGNWEHCRDLAKNPSCGPIPHSMTNSPHFSTFGSYTTFLSGEFAEKYFIDCPDQSNLATAAKYVPIFNIKTICHIQYSPWVHWRECSCSAEANLPDWSQWRGIFGDDWSCAMECWWEILSVKMRNAFCRERGAGWPTSRDRISQSKSDSCWANSSLRSYNQQWAGHSSSWRRAVFAAGVPGMRFPPK